MTCMHIRMTCVHMHAWRTRGALKTAAKAAVFTDLNLTWKMASRLPRHTFDVYFRDTLEKDAFTTRMKNLRERLTPPGKPLMSYHDFMLSMFDIVEEQATHTQPTTAADTTSMMRSNGIYTGDDTTEDSCLFVTETHTFNDLVKGLGTPCTCGMSRSPWEMESTVQKGHVLRVLFSCRRCHRKRIWASSRVFASHYLVNQKLVHSFTCAGMLPVQYTKFSRFAGLGVVGTSYISHVYRTCGYLRLAQEVAGESMQAAVDEVHTLSDYATKGEWVMTDARHDSTANAYHSTVACLSGSTSRIVGICTVSREKHTIAQTRELECTKIVLPQVIARGLRVVEVAHDIQNLVSGYITKTLNLVNSFDTWHGTKNVDKQMRKITEGRVRDRGVTWFPQLIDKRKSIKLHLYWAMRNCGGSLNTLRSLIENVPEHYKGNHSACHPISPCHTAHYSPSKVQLTEPLVIQRLLDTLKGTYVYRNAAEFCRCRDTYWVESFNHQLLTYPPKRIHFSTATFTMRMNLAVLDWNENVNRHSTSERQVRDLRRPDRRTPMKVLVTKTFGFVERLWAAYLASNISDLRPLVEIGRDEDEELLEDGAVVEDEEPSDVDNDDDDGK